MVGEGKAGVNGEENIELRSRTSNAEGKRGLSFDLLWGGNKGM
jgi:hypothetical protein